MNLRDKWIVVTGGSSGIGAEIARQLAVRGNRVTIVAEHAERLSAAAASIAEAASLRPETLRCDLADRAQTQELGRTLTADGACPDLIVHCAGFGTYTPFARADADEIEALLAVNLTAHVRLTHALLPAMIARRSGAVCFVTSIAGRLPITPNATYCAAKHGMIGLADALRYELAPFNVEVTAVCPGRVDTPFFDHPTFRERTRGPENQSALPVERVARATIAAIERAQRITYIPRVLGIASWLFEALPPLARPLFNRLMHRRIERLYADLNR